MRAFILGFVAIFTCIGAAPVQALDDHGGALAAVADIRAAVTEIVRIENGYAVGHGVYLRAAHRALNALVGAHDADYAVAAGDPGDGVGALGHVDHLLDKSGTALWTPAMQGAKANLLAAAQNVHDALHEKEMEDYQADLTQALANLALVVGRPMEDGVLGGLSGALGNTVLGVPSTALQVSGCSLPAKVPAYGVVSEHLTYVALPRRVAATELPADLGVRRVVVSGDKMILYTYASEDVASLCRHAAAHMQRARRVSPSVAAPALYTTAQAHTGAAVYAQNCTQCHGANLQGISGPAVAGTEFLTTARGNSWTLSVVRTVVFENMPLSNPGSLSPKQYAAVMAFLLASNCYPAGSKPFPENDAASLAAVKLGPVHGTTPTNAKLGTCAVK
jgi:polar amino acid transport system substrate-binding protein